MLNAEHGRETLPRSHHP